MTTEQTLDAVYKAWVYGIDEDADQSRQRFDEALIGRFYSYEALAEHVLYDTGDVDDLLNKVDSNLAPYVIFDYQMFGRDLELSGDVYSVELDDETYYFWSSI
jgi:antirestriction protein